MKKTTLVALTVLFMSALVPCHGQQSVHPSDTEDPVLLTIDGEPVRLSEFLYIYDKNNTESSIEKKTKDEYLDLFINFKLKVHEARQQGIDTTRAFLDELKGYRAQAVPKYLRDDEAIDSLVRLSYDRLSRDRRAAHIAIECPPNAPDSVVADALRRINEARERVTTGRKEDFFAVAREVSTDPSVGTTGGELGWIVVFRYVYALEDAIYSTPVGEVSPVFRSAYGFHIALIEEERAHEEVQAAHIMKMVPKGNDSVDVAKKAEIDELYEQIMGGADFAELAQAHSDDKGSSIRGGDLGWFGRGLMVRPFEEAAFGMKEGEIGRPIRSDFGWHIIRKTGTRGIQPFEEMRAQIEQRVNRDERMKEAEKRFIVRTREEYQLPAEMSDEEVIAYADAHLEEKYPMFRNLVNEYHDGILLFDVSLKEVWDKAGQDTKGLENYFQTHKKEYTWEKPKFKGYIVYCKDETTARAARAIIRNTKEPDSIAGYLNQRLNLDSVTYVKFTRGVWEKGKNAAVDKFGFKDKKAEYTPKEDMPVVFAEGKIIKAPQSYMDERGKVTTDYQDFLEKEWVKTLREKYNVVVNKEVMESGE